MAPIMILVSWLQDFPPSGVNTGSEYLSSFGRKFAFEEIPFRICRAQDDCVRGGGRERHLKGVVAGACQIEAVSPPHPGMGSGALQKGHRATEPLSWIYSHFSMWKVWDVSWLNSYDFVF